MVRYLTSILKDFDPTNDLKDIEELRPLANERRKDYAMVKRVFYNLPKHIGRGGIIGAAVGGLFISMFGLPIHGNVMDYIAIGACVDVMQYCLRLQSFIENQ